MNSTQISAVLGEQIKVLNEIHSIEYTITRELGGTSPYKVTIHWWEAGNQYKYDFKSEPTANGSSRISRIESYVSYDGSVTQALRGSASMVTISRGEHGRLETFDNEMSFFTPFEFILTRNGNQSDRIPRLRDFSQPKLIPFLETRALDAQEVSLAGHQCIALSFPGGIERYTKVPVTYRVFFAKDLDFYPIGWDQQNSDGKKLVSYRVDDVQAIIVNGYKVNYPAKAKMDYFSYNPSQVFTEPVNQGMVLKVVSVRLNQLDDSDLKIDPSLYTKIWDIDKQVVIPVSK